MRALIKIPRNIDRHYRCTTFINPKLLLLFFHPKLSTQLMHPLDFLIKKRTISSPFRGLFYDLGAINGL